MAGRGVVPLFRRFSANATPFIGKGKLVLNNINSYQSGKILRCGNFHTSVCILAKRVTKLKRPVDDVYLEDLYEPKKYNLEEAVVTLKRYMELDFADQYSVVHLKLNLHLAPKGKGKFQSFIKMTKRPHNFDHRNKICVFTDDADVIKSALEDGACYAGGNDVIQRISFGNVECDMYLATTAYCESAVRGHVELTKAIGKLMPTRRRGITDDIPSELEKWRDGMIINNVRGEKTKCNVAVGLINQPAEEITENIKHVLTSVRLEQNPKHPPIIVSASVNCCEEQLMFELVDEED